MSRVVPSLLLAVLLLLQLLSLGSASYAGDLELDDLQQHLLQTSQQPMFVARTQSDDSDMVDATFDAPSAGAFHVNSIPSPYAASDFSEMDEREFQLFAATTSGASGLGTDCTRYAPCANGGTCIQGAGEGNYTCLCTSSFTGKNCTVTTDVCAGVSCNNGGTCRATSTTTFVCDCAPNYSGLFCDTYTSPCASNPCLNGATCNVVNSQANCTCATGYSGSTCATKIEYCKVTAKPCGNNGTCVEGVGKYSCSCDLGYSGDNCQTKFDPCAGVDCHQGTCVPDSPLTSKCSCNAGYTGGDCSSRISWCANNPNPCSNGGICVDTNSASAPFFTCTCNSAVWSGTTCTTAVQCQTNPCSNGGTCAGSTTYGFTCSNCNTGFTGDRCDVMINHCNSTSCGNGGTCTNSLTGFSCSCPTGYSSSSNCYAITDFCSIQATNNGGFACANGGTCANAVTGAKCTCPSGFSGSRCETAAPACTAGFCTNGFCEIVNGSPTCNCPAGYFTGTKCETLADNCASSPCKNGGNCTNRADIGTYTCTCPTGFALPTCSNCATGRTGSNCQTSENPPPRVASARMSNDLKWIIVTFDQATNRLGASVNSLSCSSILSTATLSSIGSGAVCYWSSSTSTTDYDQLVIDVTSASSFATNIGDSITILPGLVVRADGHSMGQSDATYLSAKLAVPNVQPPVTVVVNAPTSSGGCDGVTLSDGGSTGNYNRPFTYTWSVLKTDAAQLTQTQIDNINAILQASSSNTVTVSAFYLPPGRTYTFQLKVTNWARGSATATVAIAKGALSTVPTIELPGGSSFTINRADSLSVVSKATIAQASCATSTLVSYQWSFVKASNDKTPDLSGVVLTNSTLVLSPNTLAAGVSYNFLITVKVSVLDQSTSSSSNVFVTVNPSSSPAVVKAYLDSSSTGMWVLFDRDTDKASMKSSTPCSSLFDNSFIQLFSYKLNNSTNSRTLKWNTACSWTSASLLFMGWDLDVEQHESGKATSAQLIPSTIVVGINVLLKANVLKSADGFSAAMGASSVVLQAPSTQPNPTVALSAPASISSCDSLLLDGSATVSEDGRAVTTYLWELASSSTSSLSTAALNILSQATTSTVRFAAGVVTPGSYTFRLTATNSFGKSSSVTRTVTVVVGQVPALQVTGAGSSLTVDYYLNIEFTISSSPACGGSSSVQLSMKLKSASPQAAVDKLGGVNAVFAVKSGYNTLSTTRTVPGSTQVFTITATDSTSGLSNSVDLTVNVNVVPPPKIVSITTLKTASTVDVVFDRATNGTGTVDCASVWSTASYNLFKGQTAPRCKWKDRKTLSTVLGSRSTFSVGTSVSFNTQYRLCSEDLLSAMSDLTSVSSSSASRRLLSTGVAANADFALTPSQYVAVLSSSRSLSTSSMLSRVTSGSSGASLEIAAPSDVPVPVVRISAASQISQCENITLNAGLSGGNAGRAFSTVVWYVVPDPLQQLTQSQYDTINAFLFKFTGLEVNIPSGFLPSRRTYVFGVKLINWLGGSGAGEVSVYVSSTSAPVVRLLDASVQTVTVNQAVVVNTLIERSSCDTSSDSIYYTWSVVSSPLNAFVLPSYTAHLSNLWFKPYTLLSNAQYVFRVTATTFGNPTGTNATVTINTKPASVVAILANSNTTQTAADLKSLPTSLFAAGTMGLIIDASASYDVESMLRSKPQQNFLPSMTGFPAGGSVTYKFGCTWLYRQTDCFADTQPSQASSSSPYWYVPSTLLRDTSVAGVSGTPDQYLFYVYVQYGSTDLRSPAYAAATFGYLTSSVPSGLRIAAIPSIVLDYESLTLTALPPSGGDSYSFKWSAGALNTINLADSSVALTPLTSTSLVLAPYSLVPSSQVEFVVTMTSLSKPWLNSTSASVWVTVASVPESGYCSMSPSVGVSGVDSFSVGCYEWSDVSSTAALSFEYLLLDIDASTQKEVGRTRLGVSQGANAVPLANMPPGKQALGYQHVLRAIITNSFGGRTSYDFKATVYPPPATVTQSMLNLDAASAVQQELSTAAQRGDYNTFASLLQSLVVVGRNSLSTAQLSVLTGNLLTHLSNFHSASGNDSRIQSTTEGLEAHAALLSLVCSSSSLLNLTTSSQCLNITGDYVRSLQIHATSTDSTTDLNTAMLSTLGEVFKSNIYGAACVVNGSIITGSAATSLYNSTSSDRAGCVMQAPSTTTEFPDSSAYPYSAAWWNYLYFHERASFLSNTDSNFRLALILEAQRRQQRTVSNMDIMKTYLAEMSVSTLKRHAPGQTASRMVNQGGFMQLVSQKHDSSSISGAVLSNFGVSSGAFTSAVGDFTYSLVPCIVFDSVSGTNVTSTCNVTSARSGTTVSAPSSVTSSFAPGSVLTVQVPSSGLVDNKGNSLMQSGSVYATIFTTLDFNPYTNTLVNGTNSTASENRSPVFSFSLVDITTYSSQTATYSGSSVPVNTNTGLAGDPNANVAVADGVPVKVANLSQPIVFVVPHTTPVNLTVSGTVCQWWDASSNSWSTVGCSRISAQSTSLYTTCACLHLTDFRIGLGSPESLLHPSITLLTLDDLSDFTWRHIQDHPTVFLTLLIVFGVYFLLLPFVHHMDQRRFFDVWNEEANRELHRHEVYLETGILMTDAELYELTMRERELEVKKALLKGNLNLNANWNQAAGEDAPDFEQMTAYQRAVYEQQKLQSIQQAEKKAFDASFTQGNVKKAAVVPQPHNQAFAAPAHDPASSAAFMQPAQAVEQEELYNPNVGVRNRFAPPPPPPNQPPSVPAPSPSFSDVLPTDRTTERQGVPGTASMQGKASAKRVSGVTDPHAMMSQIRQNNKQKKLNELTPEQELKMYNDRPFSERWYYRVKHNFKYNHLYISILYRKKNDVLTGVEKLTCVLCYVLGCMLVNAAFYQNKQNTVWAYIAAAIISSVVIIPTKLILRQVFGYSGAVFEEKRNKFRQQYRKIIAAKIASDLKDQQMPLQTLDKKLGLQNPTNEERTLRLQRQQQYCDLLMNESATIWERATYQEKQSLDDVSDTDLIARQAQVDAKDAAAPKAAAVSKRQVAPAPADSPQSLAELDQVNALERQAAEDMMDEHMMQRQRRLDYLKTKEYKTQAERLEEETIEREIADRVSAAERKKNQSRRLPACCKPFMMVLAFCWCVITSIVMLMYGVKFDLAAERGGVSQDSDPFARSYLWLLSCLFSWGQDVLVNEPIILCIKAAAAILLGNVYSKVVNRK